jgi:hypothetical protein
MTPCILTAPFSVFSSFPTYSILTTSNIFIIGDQQWQWKYLIQAKNSVLYEWNQLVNYCFICNYFQVKILVIKWNDIGLELTIKETTIFLINSSSTRNYTQTTPLLTNVDHLCCSSTTDNFTVSRQWLTILGSSVLWHRLVSPKNTSLSVNKLAMGQVILPILLPSSVRFVPPVVCTHSFTQ